MQEKLLKELSDAFGPSGYEDAVAKIMSRELKKTVDKVDTDEFGNVIGFKKGSKNAPTVMLAAHMDEIGFMVRGFSDKGFVRFEVLGGFDNRSLLNRTVTLRTGKGVLKGVIGIQPPHSLDDKERKKIYKHHELYMDFGFSDKKEAEEKVEIGDMAVFSDTFERLGKNRVCMKALDNRVGCCVLLEAAKSVKTNANVYYVGTVQEEVGLKGAKMVAYALEPDYAVALDTCIANDTPFDKSTEVFLGKGPGITLLEAGGRGLITHPRLKKLFVESAKKNKIPYQLEVVMGGATDAASIYLSKKGIPSISVGVPSRYIHSGNGVCDLSDAENAAKLISAALKSL